MRDQFTRTAALALILITLVSLLVGYKDIAKPAVAEAAPDDVTTAETREVPLETATYGVMTGSVAEIYIGKTYPNAKISTYTAIPDAFLALSNGKIDYVMTPYTTAVTAIRKNDALCIYQNNVEKEKIACGVSKDNEALRDNIDAVLTTFKKDGTLDQIIANWTVPDKDYVLDDVPIANGKNGVLRVAINADREPMCFVMDNTYRGLDCELARRIAYALDMKVEFQNMQFTGLIAALQSGKADVILSNLSVTEERAEQIAFTQSYFDNPQVLVSRGNTVTDSEVPQYTAISQLSGKVVSSQTGSVLDILVDSVVPNVTFSYFNTHIDALAALQNGKVEAVPLDEPLARLAIAQNADLAILPEQLAEDHYGMALQKDSPLTDQVNAAIAKLKADGTLEQMKEKWTGSNESAKTLPQLDYPGANGTLRVAYDIAAEPMTYMGKSGTVVGHDVELMLRIGQILDRKMEFICVNFSSFIPMLQSNKVDVALGSLSITDERKKAVDMSESFYDGGVYFVVRKVAVEPSTVTTQLQTSFWDGLKASFTRTFLTENRWKLVLDGLGVTVLISICSGILGSLMGFGICMLRRSKRRITALPTACFIRLIQGTPIVVLLMILYYIVFGNVDISAILVAIFGFAVNFGVYVSEMMRTGIDAVDNGQIEAAYALGFTKVKTFWKITFPQAARHFLPVFQGEFISMVKMTSVVGYIAIQDLTKASDIIRSRTLEAFFPLIATAIIYFLVANTMTMLLSRLEISLDPKRRGRTVKGVVMK